MNFINLSVRMYICVLLDLHFRGAHNNLAFLRACDMFIMKEENKKLYITS